MKSVKKVLLFGLLVWAIPFMVSFFIFSFQDSNRALFESIMAVAVALTVVIFSVLYFKSIEKDFVKEGVLLGLIFFTISVIIDLAMFMPSSPMQITLVEYINDIGVTYLIIPVITIGSGYLLSSRLNK